MENTDHRRLVLTIHHIHRALHYHMNKEDTTATLYSHRISLNSHPFHGVLTNSHYL
jgi:hypothetical protein